MLSELTRLLLLSNSHTGIALISGKMLFHFEVRPSADSKTAKNHKGQKGLLREFLPVGIWRA
jgi:hypothetical protein